MIRDRDSKNWPHRALSRFETIGKIRWHIQEAGQGETVLLLHGTGASAHSWRHVILPLAESHHVLTVDLPGQGFTSTGSQAACSLPGMSTAIARMLAGLGHAPAIIIGHSAGAAIAYQLALDLPQTPRRVVSINGALEPFPGLAGAVMPLSARMMGFGAIGANFVSLTLSSESAVRRLIEATGSRIDAAGLDCYRKLVADSGHVDATIAMMARWDLGPLIARAAEITAASLLLTGGRDRAVSPQTSVRWAERVPNAEKIHLPDCGHLLHEEAEGAHFLAHTARIIG